MNMKEYIDQAEKDLLHTYNRYQIVLDKGEGVHLFDIEGKEYLDFVAGISVFALGYGNKEYNDVLKGQIEYDFELERYEKLFAGYGIPVFRLETDYSYQDIEQLRIRLEAFSEMLAQNRYKGVKQAK